MVIKVQNETPFQVLSDSFTIGPSETGYELQVGATSQDFSTLFSVGANTPRMVTNVANGSYYRLKGNSGEVSVNWQRTCKGGGGGEGGSNTELDPVMDFPAGAVAGTVVAYAGSSSAAGVYQYDGTDWIPVGVDDLSAYWTSAQTQAYVEDKELPIAAAVNVLKSDMEARLDQQYYKKQEVNNLLNEKVTAQVNVQIKNYTDPAIAEVYDTIEDKELPVSAALNELNEKVNEISGNTGGGDMDKLLPISGLPVSAEVGTMVSYPIPLGYWERDNESGTSYTFTITDTDGRSMSAATIAVVSGVGAGTPISIEYVTNNLWVCSGHNLTQGDGWFLKRWTEDNIEYAIFVYVPYRNTLRLYFMAGAPSVDLATISTFYEPKGANVIFRYNGTGWEDTTYTLPMANQNTLGGVKVGDYNYGSPLYIESDGHLNIAADRLGIFEVETSNQTKSVLVNWEMDRNDAWVYEPGTVFNIPFFSLSASVSFKSSELAEHYDVSDNELFGATYAPNGEEPHLHLYYNKAEEQDPYYTFDDLEETGDMPRFDLVDGTSAFTFAVAGDDGNEYTYTANVTVANGDDVSVVITIRNDSEDKDAGVDIWSGEIEMGAPITLNGSPDIALAKFGREFDPDLGDAVQKWSKYYNEDNINEVTDNLVKNEGGVSGIWKGNQAEYDTLTNSGATADPNTFYIIVNN